MADVRLRWILDVIDHGAGKALLKQDREIRKSLSTTDKQWTKTARSASSAADRQAQAAKRVATATRGVGRAAVPASNEVRRYADAQRQALAVGQRIIQQSGRVEQAYRRQARAAQEASRAQRVSSAAQKGGAGLAAAGGAAIGRGAAVAAPLAAGFGLAVAGRDAVSFEKVMAGVQARLLTTGANMRRLSDFALELGAKTQFSAGQAAAAMDELAAQGFSVKEIFKVLPGTLNLAAASGTDLASAAEIQTAALRGFGLAASDAGRVADVLSQTANRSAVDMFDLGETLKYVAPIAKATGQSFESMLAAVGLMGNVGIKGSQAGTTLRTALVRLTSPTVKAKGALKDLGISAGSLRGPKGLDPLPVILGRIVKGAQGVDKGTRNAALAAIFGREALSGMIALIEGGPKKFAAMQQALEHSSGASQRAAKIMRNTVAGAWDNFTGSVETAAITLTRRFMPAVKNSLNAAAGGVNRAVKAIPGIAAAVGTGLAGRQLEPTKRISRASGRTEVTTTDPTKAQQVAQKIGELVRTVGTAAATAGKQLLDAFKPALPFFQNILIPLFGGIAKGLIPAIVVSFKILAVAIKVVATVLGLIGKAAAPFRGVIAGIGTVIGFLAAGPILRLLSGLGKVGIVFRALGAPIKLVTGLLGMVGRAVGRAVAAMGGLTKIGAIAGRAGKLAVDGLLFLPRKMAQIGVAAVKALADRFSHLGGMIAGAVRDKLKGLLNFFGGLGVAIVRAIVRGIKSLPNAIWDGIKSAAGGAWGIVKKLPGVPGRRGGRAHPGGFRRYQGGGLVPAMVSPGEAVSYGGASWMVPGAPTASDSVFTMLPTGAAVLTADGQARMAAGASMASALATQAPHFGAGGLVTGRYTSTAYGPPWNRMNGTGVTATGVDLRPARHAYGVAVDPSMIPLRSQVYAWPNPFGYGGRFKAFDTGGAIKGRRVDFYDWRGRKSQMGWGRRSTRISASQIHGGSGDDSGGGSASVPLSVGRSATRAGLLDDAFSSALDAARSGTSPGRALFAASLREALGGAKISRDVKTPGGGDTGGGSWSRWSRSHTAAWATAFGRHFGLRRTSGYRTPAHNRSVGGVEGSLHTLGTARNPHAFDFVGSRMNEALGSARRLHPHAAEAMIHNAGSGNHLHVGLFRRRGGRIRRFRSGGGVSFNSTGSSGRGPGRLGGALNALTQSAGGSLAHFLDVIDDALSSKLEGLRRSLVRQIHRGGDSRTVARLQAALSAVDEVLGRRVGRILRKVDRDKAHAERASGQFDRALRGNNVDPSSALGLGAQIAFAGGTTIPTAQRTVGRLERAAKRARAAGHITEARAIEDELAQAQDDLAEAVTLQIERGRDLIRVAAQEVADRTQFGVDSAQNALTGLDISQRLRGTADTPGGMRERAAAIQSTLLPALQANRQALIGQQSAAAAIGDQAGWRAATLAIQSAGNDIASALADAADLLKQAAETAAQDVVDSASHRRTLADYGLQRLELEQRIGGTFTGGGQARAAFITTKIIPALQSELAALRSQQRTAQEQGDPKLADQIAEAIAGKQNDILSATLDANEATASNTEDLANAVKEVTGSVAFNFNGQGFTDVIGAGVGA